MRITEENTEKTTMRILQPGTLLVLLAHAHVLFSLRNNGEVRTKEEAAHSSRTFHSSLREGRLSKARELQVQGAGMRERGTLNSTTHPWKRVMAEETWRMGHNGNNNKHDSGRTVTPVEEPNAVPHWARHHNKRIKLNSSTGTPAGGRYNAPKPSSMGRGDGGGGPEEEEGVVEDEEEGDRHKRGTKGLRRGRNQADKSAVVPWEPVPRPLALTSTDLPFDLYTRRPEFFTFREENPWDATPITPPSSQDFGDEIKNPFYPVTSETYGAYAITCVSGVIFLVGIAGNIAILCIVCQNYYMKSISNSLLANLAVWDFVLILFCLPMVVFHELTKSWLLGEFTCKVVPYVEVKLIPSPFSL